MKSCANGIVPSKDNIDKCLDSGCSEFPCKAVSDVILDSVDRPATDAVFYTWAPNHYERKNKKNEQRRYSKNLKTT